MCRHVCTPVIHMNSQEIFHPLKLPAILYTPVSTCSCMCSDAICTCSITFSPVPLAGLFLFLALLVGVLRLGGLRLVGLFFLAGLVVFFLVFLAGLFSRLFRANLSGAGGLVGELLFREEGVAEVLFSARSTA